MARRSVITESVTLAAQMPAAREGVHLISDPGERHLAATAGRVSRQPPGQVLIVPSVVTLVERNVLINQEHPEFPLIRASQAVPVRWDARLWKSPRR
jgi:RES domain-containing protein